MSVAGHYVYNGKFGVDSPGGAWVGENRKCLHALENDNIVNSGRNDDNGLTMLHEFAGVECSSCCPIFR